MCRRSGFVRGFCKTECEGKAAVSQIFFGLRVPWEHHVEITQRSQHQRAAEAEQHAVACKPRNLRKNKAAHHRPDALPDIAAEE